MMCVYRVGWHLPTATLSYKENYGDLKCGYKYIYFFFCPVFAGSTEW